MPKKNVELTPLQLDKTLRNAGQKDGKYPVGGVDGLYLRLKNGFKSWVLRIRVGNRIKNGVTVPHFRDVGLGSFPDVTIAHAREKAREYRQKVAGGIDPIAEREKAKADALLAASKKKTFQRCADEFIESARAGWKNPRHEKQWVSTLTTYAFPKIGHLRVSDIDMGLVLAVLQQPVEVDDGKTQQFWLAKNETASRLRARIEKILDWAAVRGLRDDSNPARWKGRLDTQLPAPSKVQSGSNFPALPYDRIGEFMADLRQHKGISPRALEFCILTAARSGEAIGARWSEIDVQKRLWTVPATRMKKGKEHQVPLSDAAMAVLEALPRIVGTDLLFPAPRGGALTDMAMTSIIRKMHAKAVKAGERGYTDPKQYDRVVTAHGMRSTFRDWAGETTAYPQEVCEHALSHKEADATVAAYQRGSLLGKRAALMTDWARFCATPAVKAGNVVTLRGGAA